MNLFEIGKNASHSSSVPIFLSFVSTSYSRRKHLFSLFYNEETSWKTELNIFKGRRVHDPMRNEDWRRENKTKWDPFVEIEKSWKKTGETDVLSPERRWKIVEAFVALCAVVVGQKWRIAMNRRFPDHYSILSRQPKLT